MTMMTMTFRSKLEVTYEYFNSPDKKTLLSTYNIVDVHIVFENM